MKTFWKGTLIVGMLLMLVGVVALLKLKPEQAQITEEVLQQKSEDSEAYLEFIDDNMVTGGPPKDGIPAVDEPKYLTSEEAQYELSPEDIVFGIDYGGLTIAYPQSIMYWHEIVNEKTEDGTEISVTYCPLTGSVIGYTGKNLGVSGKLYNNNLVMYDRDTDSEYPQMLGRAVNGPDKGNSLGTFPMEVTTWSEWLAAHSDTKVLSRDTGHTRAYDDPPYQGYDDAYRIWFPVAAESDLYHNKRIIHGIEHDGIAIAVLKENLTSIKYDTPNDILTITLNDVLDTVQVTAESGQKVKHFDAYWFAWYAYHPDTRVLSDG